MTCSDLIMELLFTLTHPELVHKAICDIVNLLRCKSTIRNVDQQPVDDPAGSTLGEQDVYWLVACIHVHIRSKVHETSISTSFN